MGVYYLDLVTPGTYLCNTIDKTDIVYALNQYVGKHLIIRKHKIQVDSCVFWN
jgi:hypothetical protein